MAVHHSFGVTRSFWPNRIGFLALFCATLFQVLCIIQPLEFLIDVVFARDDAFYYFVIARNVAETGRATFDGIHLSNGVQLLWHYVLVALAYLDLDKLLYLRVVLGVCVGLNILVGLLIWQLGRRLHSVMLGDIALIFWAGIMVERWNTLQGMEFSLHIAIILGILLVLWGIWQAKVVAPGPAALLALLVTLNFWTRLDAVLFSIPIWCVCIFWLWIWRDRASVQLASLAALVVIPSLGVLLYLWGNYQMAETVLPLSGDVKRHYSAVFFDDVDGARPWIERAGWWLKIQSMMVLGLVPSLLLEIRNHVSFNPASEPVHLIVPLVIFAAVVGGAVWIWRRYGVGSTLGRVVLAGVLLFGLSGIHVLVNVLALADFSHVTRHYYGWLLVFWLVWGSVLLVCLLEALPDRGRTALAAVFIGGAGLSYGITGYQFLAEYTPEETNYAPIRMKLSADLSQELAPDAIVGAWNAGVLGYFLDRPVVNLDGLVNDKAFRDVLVSGRPLQEYLQKVGVTHLIDHNKRDLTLAYEETRDTKTFFRNGISWDEVDALKQVGDIYVLEVKE